MTYRVRIDPVALDQIEQFAAWLSDYSEDFAIEQIERLDEILRLNLGEIPLTWGYFGSETHPFHLAWDDGYRFAPPILRDSGFPKDKRRPARSAFRIVGR